MVDVDIDADEMARRIGMGDFVNEGTAPFAINYWFEHFWLFTKIMDYGGRELLRSNLFFARTFFEDIVCVDPLFERFKPSVVDLSGRFRLANMIEHLNGCQEKPDWRRFAQHGVEQIHGSPRT